MDTKLPQQFNLNNKIFLEPISKIDHTDPEIFSIKEKSRCHGRALIPGTVCEKMMVLNGTNTNSRYLHHHRKKSSK